MALIEQGLQIEQLRDKLREMHRRAQQAEREVVRMRKSLEDTKKGSLV